jgi:hypothetical protein
MPWIDQRGLSEFRDGGIVKAKVVARRDAVWEATDLTGKLASSGAGERLVGSFRSLEEAKRAIEGLWSYCDSEVPGPG